jgi:hypothetical protein
MREWRYSVTIFALGTGRRLVVGFRSLGRLIALSLCKDPPQYPLGRNLGVSQNRSGRCGVEKTLVPAGNRTLAVQPVARAYTDSVKL